jgi:FSR family fosmidomycin resistance protein-like MFS transporter
VLLLAVELFDELVSGVREAAWPLVRTDLHLDYVQIGLLLSLPIALGTLVEPAFGILIDAGWRRRLMIAGGTAYAAALALMGVAWSFPPLLLATLVYYPAAGALVEPAQATLMDLQPAQRAAGMARWTLVGSLGAVAGPLALGAAVVAGGGWRLAMFALALAGLATALASARLREPAPAADEEEDGPGAGWRRVLAALRDRDVLRCLLLLELTELGGDVFGGFIALYVADVVHGGALAASAAVAVWTGAGLVGDALVLLVLARLPSRRVLRVSALAFGALLPAFLLAPGLAPKLVALAALSLSRSAWYPLLKSRLFDALPGSSGTAVALSSAAGAISTLLPLAIGVLAAAAGLGGALWLALLAPAALIALAPRATLPPGSAAPPAPGP